MIGRVIGTVVATLIYGWVMMVYAPQATLMSAETAGQQLDNTDAGYFNAVYTMSFFSAIGTVATVLFVGILAGIWYRPLRDALERSARALAVLIAAGGALIVGATDGRAFFEKTDRTEIYPILPNQSAFWIPEVGATKDKQVQMDSEAFLNDNKVQLNRFQIPHQKLTAPPATACLPAGTTTFRPGASSSSTARRSRANGSTPSTVAPRPGRRGFPARARKAST